MKNLKPFDLQAALDGKAVMLRDGRKAYVRHHEAEIAVMKNSELLGVATCSGRGAVECSWNCSGMYWGGIEDNRDIIGMYPETRVINGFEVPAPEIKELAHLEQYYVAAPSVENLCLAHTWVGDRRDRLAFSRGIVFLNKEDAIANAKAMLGIDPHSEAES